MKKADAQISISINIDCPYCEETIDLMDFQYLKDDGYIYSELLRSDGFGKDDWDEVVECPECNKEFLVGTVEW